MPHQNHLETITEIFRKILGRDDLDLRIETTAADVPEWDSLSHIRLIIAIERAYGFKFSASEIQKLTNIGDLVARIQEKS